MFFDVVVLLLGQSVCCVIVNRGSIFLSIYVKDQKNELKHFLLGAVQRGKLG